MAINRDYAGRTFPASEPYEVSRVKIAEFAAAIGDLNPVYRDQAAARAAGHPDVIAPPTFAIVISMSSAGTALADPGLGLNYAMVVHGEQRFTYERPIVAGDVLIAQPTITEIRDAGRNVMLTTSTQIRTADGELVCTAVGTLVERGA
jgi:acyl dehydratase